MESGVRMPLRPYLSLLITMPCGIFSVEEAKEVIQAVNVEQVAPEDQLSDSVYIYMNGELKKI